ncbi:hypothetical protein CCR75_003209 [Bremia lactucae]|uniref:Uncharacterized protein n=1 Tax=Bremia lactucae TaxID=4779 RepID=A0A976NZ12_BRELC|nr:hypothetical protein CCR75_003209 [Bremia lactucae]
MTYSSNGNLSPAKIKPERLSNGNASPPTISAEVRAWKVPEQEDWKAVKQLNKGVLSRIVTYLSSPDRIRKYSSNKHKDFWATYRWDENPWIVDTKGDMLSTTTYFLLQACLIADFCIRRVSTLDYSMDPEYKTAFVSYKIKLGRWATAILVADPYLHVVEQLQLPAQLTLREGPRRLKHYIWTTVSPGLRTGTIEHIQIIRPRSCCIKQTKQSIGPSVACEEL